MLTATKPFEFSIHGYIDGFSRKLIWLGVGPPNKNSEVIGKYYLDAILQIGGVSEKMRSVNGASFSFGTSTSNQRIEAYWTWVNFLKDLRDFDLYNDLILFKSICYDFGLWTYSEMNYTKLLKCGINMYKP